MLYNRIIELIIKLDIKVNKLSAWDEEYMKILFKDMLLIRVNASRII